jgi:hypothetical protein
VRPAQGDVQATRPAPAALATAECPACGKSVPELCLLCPHCEEPLAERHHVRRPGAGEDDFWLRLRPKLLWAMWLVGSVGVLACMLLPLVAFLSRNVPGIAGGALVLVLVTIVVAALAVPLVLGPRSEEARSWMRFLGQALAAFGCAITLGFAVILFLAVVCAVLLR